MLTSTESLYPLYTFMSPKKSAIVTIWDLFKIGSLSLLNSHIHKIKYNRHPKKLCLIYTATFPLGNEEKGIVSNNSYR